MKRKRALPPLVVGRKRPKSLLDLQLIRKRIAEAFTRMKLAVPPNRRFRYRKIDKEI